MIPVMMSAMDNQAGWTRLAHALVARRIALGFPRRSDWVKHLGVGQPRTIADLENARRDNYTAATLAQVEHWYRWGPGSVDDVLAGGEPIALSVPSSDPDGDFARGVRAGVEAQQYRLAGWPIGLDENNVAAMRGAMHALGLDYGQHTRRAREIREQIDAALTELEKGAAAKARLGHQMDLIWDRLAAVLGRAPENFTPEEYSVADDIALLLGHANRHPSGEGATDGS